MSRLDVNRSGEMEVFVRVVELGGFSTAARAFKMTPSAISKLVARLEARLGVRLINRSTRKLQLTPEGTAFYERAVRILDEIAAAEREAAVGATPSGLLRVNTSVPFGLHRLLPLLPAWKSAPPIHLVKDGGILRVVRAAPVAMLAAFACGLGEQVAFSFLPIFAVEAKVPAETGALWLSAFVIGNIVLQWPIGWAADELDRRIVLAVCALVSAALVASIAFIDPQSNAILVVLVLWGGISFGIYTVGLALLGQRFSGGDIARANAAFTIVYTVAGLVGRPIAGGAMDVMGRSGMTSTVMLFYVIAGVAALLALRRRD